MTEIYADTVAEVIVSNGIARIDFVAMSPTARDAEGKPTMEFRQRVVMPLSGMLGCYSAMTRVIEQLQQRGVLSIDGRKPTGGDGETISVG